MRTLTTLVSLQIALQPRAVEHAIDATARTFCFAHTQHQTPCSASGIQPTRSQTP